MGEINKRRGRVLGMHPANTGYQTINAEVPVAEMHDFFYIYPTEYPWKRQLSVFIL